MAIALNIGVLAITARALGPELLGILMLIEAFASLIDQVVRLETWQALIRYGVMHLEHRRPEDFRRVIKFGALLDVSGALLAMVVAVASVPLAATWLGWGPDAEGMAFVYSLAILFNLSSTPVAVLRIFNRFAVVAWIDVANASLRLVLAAAAYALGGGLWTFLICAMLARIAAQLGLCLAAFLELRRQGHADFLSVTVRGATKAAPGVWPFLWSTNAAVLIRKSTLELDSLIVGGLLGPSAVSAYQIAKRISKAAVKGGALLQQATFPELARLWARREVKRFVRLIALVSGTAALIATSATFVLALNAERAVTYLAGAEFHEAVAPLVIQMAAASLLLSGGTLRSALQIMGLEGKMLIVTAIAAAVFYLSLLLATPQIGIIGASLSHAAFGAIWLISMLGIFGFGLRRTYGASAQ